MCLRNHREYGLPRIENQELIVLLRYLKDDSKDNWRDDWKEVWKEGRKEHSKDDSKDGPKDGAFPSLH